MASAQPRLRAVIPASGYGWAEHTADVELRLWAPSVRELFAEAGNAFAELALGRGPYREPTSSRTLDVQAPDDGALLVELLNELLYRADAEHWFATRFGLVELEPGRLRILARGHEELDLEAPAKAATLHGVRIERAGDGGVRATVILDV